MAKLTCEICGSTDLVKEEGLFVCQGCGMKYSTDDVKKLANELNVTDESDKELEKLYQAARNAEEASNFDTAIKHYERISEKDPNSWEAMLYITTLKTRNIINGKITVSAANVLNSVPKIVGLTKLEKDEEAIKDAIEKVYIELSYTATDLFYKATAFYKSLINTLSSKALTESQERCLIIVKILETFADLVESNFDMTDDYYRSLVGVALKDIFNLSEYYKKVIKTYTFEKDYLESIKNKILKYDPSFIAPERKGCYVATCVYGSYDCPQVWTLRRYRDNTLAATWYGRAFIKTYYAISPTLVKWFGNTNWFKKMWQGTLDRMVQKLQSEGVESTPYEDKNW